MVIQQTKSLDSSVLYVINFPNQLRLRESTSKVGDPEFQILMLSHLKLWRSFVQLFGRQLLSEGAWMWLNVINEIKELNQLVIIFWYFSLHIYCNLDKG